MLKVHEIVRPAIARGFYEKMSDLWQRRAFGHIGPDMYQHHAGRRGQESMSGVGTWAAYEKRGTLPRTGKRLFLEAIHDVAAEVERRGPVVEFGPGSMEDAQTLINATQTQEYIPVDCSLENIRNARRLVPFTKKCVIKPAIVDFFSEDNCALVDRPALGVLLGLTIGNLSGPVPSAPPQAALVRALNNVVRALPCGGHLLVSVDVCQDGAANVARYNEPWHRTFSVNHLYRLAQEFPTQGFHPAGFEYEPLWHEQSGLLSHNIRVTEDQEFKMGANATDIVRLKRGDLFHCDNSYKFHPDFFAACVDQAGMEIVSVWGKENAIQLYLLGVPARQEASHQAAKIRSSAPCPLVSSASCRLAEAQEQLRRYG